jgi:hypothetical protein
MKINQKNRIKHQILSEINNNNRCTINSISESTKHKIELIAYLLEEIKDEGYIELTEVTSLNSRYIPRDYIPEITNKGKYFILIDNGYNSIIKKYKKERFYYYAKTTAFIINSLAILLVGLFSLIISMKSNKVENENYELKQEIKELKDLLKENKTIEIDTTTTST